MIIEEVEPNEEQHAESYRDRVNDGEAHCFLFAVFFGEKVLIPQVAS